MERPSASGSRGPWWLYEEGGWAFAPGEHDRLFVGAVDGTEILVDIATANPADWETFLPKAEEVLATVQFG